MLLVKNMLLPFKQGMIPLTNKVSCCDKTLLELFLLVDASAAKKSQKFEQKKEAHDLMPRVKVERESNIKLFQEGCLRKDCQHCEDNSHIFWNFPRLVFYQARESFKHRWRQCLLCLNGPG